MRPKTHLLPGLTAGLLFLCIVTACAASEGRTVDKAQVVLPKTVGAWTRPDTPRTIDAANIFKYMDGAGEIYLGYRFDHLEVFVFEARGRKSILVELYFMKHSDDAFGLLSLDWGGEPVDLVPARKRGAGAAVEQVSWPRALYGSGLLRLWSDRIYARIMASQETPEARTAVMALGRSLVEGRANQPPPELLTSAPDVFRPDWRRRKDTVAFVRAHLVLNTLYYLGQENMLDLDPASEAVICSYERRGPVPGKRLQFLIVTYLNGERARQALAQFHRVYLPEHPAPSRSTGLGEVANAFSVEDGWLAYRLRDTQIAFVFGCKDRETATSILNQTRWIRRR
jgi:hypothetical protein